MYGDAPNELALVEQSTRWDYASPVDFDGITEHMRRIDQSKHSLLGPPRWADIMVQSMVDIWHENLLSARRMSRGPNHSGVELHGFLSYLVKCNLEGKKYSVFGYKGKQVRDNTFIPLTSHDSFMHSSNILEVERCTTLVVGGEIAVQSLKRLDMIAAVSGKKMLYEYVDKNREGDHICYISNLKKMTAHYPGWGITKTLSHILREIHEAWLRRSRA